MFVWMLPKLSVNKCMAATFGCTKMSRGSIQIYSSMVTFGVTQKAELQN